MEETNNNTNIEETENIPNAEPTADESAETVLDVIAEKLRCPNCGVAIDGTEKFCEACGYRFETPQPTYSEMPPNPVSYPNNADYAYNNQMPPVIPAEPKKSKAWLWIVIAAAATTLIAVIAVIVMSMSDKGPIVKIDDKYYFNMTVDEFEEEYNKTLEVNYRMEDMETDTKDELVDFLTLGNFSEWEIKDLDEREGMAYSAEVDGFDEELMVYCYESDETEKLYMVALVTLLDEDKDDIDYLEFMAGASEITCANICQTLFPDMDEETIDEICSSYIDAPEEILVFEEYGAEVYAEMDSDSIVIMISAECLPEK